MSYRCILADPPWKYGDKLRMSDVARSAEDQYRVMTTLDICKLSYDLDITTHADTRKVFLRTIMGQTVADDALLWLWVTDPFLLNGDGAMVCRAWGFEPKQLWTWVKGTVRDDAIVGPLGMGHYMRVDTERVILAGRGKATSLIQNHSRRNYTVVAPKNRHSAKPEEFYALVEALSPGPRLELFARQRRVGWNAVGDQL